MKKETLDAAVGMLSEELLEETNEVRKVKQKRRRIQKGFVSFAAAVLLLCLAGGWYWNRQSGDDELLPKLEITKDSGEAMGFEGYLAYEIGELAGENPWQKEMELKTLPVYQNQLSYNQYGKVVDPDLEAMERLLKEIAGRLGISAEWLEITDDVPIGEKREAILEKIGEEDSEDYFIPSKLIAKVEGLSIEVDATLTAEIHLEPARELPEGYHYSYQESSYEEIGAVADYLKEQYQELLGMEKPVRNIYGGDYTYDGKAKGQIYYIGFYEGGGDIIDQILQYHFYQVRFYCNEEGELNLIRFYHSDLSKKTGDYPLISWKEAETLLENGNYITSVPEEFPGLEYVSKVELTYRSGNQEAYYMPYYRFYVELPEWEKDGLKTYGAYYVPAVEGEYLTSMPVWDGNFS
ncbi:MAG: hypothetical protein HFI40_06280 [Lachnospiraceae bacterium]|jgi:hypothetical protein|nr:hypothetical protein [Lachnospiraceae bacterium]